MRVLVSTTGECQEPQEAASDHNTAVLLPTTERDSAHNKRVPVPTVGKCQCPQQDTAKKVVPVSTAVEDECPKYKCSFKQKKIASARNRSVLMPRKGVPVPVIGECRRQEGASAHNKCH